MTIAVMADRLAPERGVLLRSFLLACLVEALLIAATVAGSIAFPSRPQQGRSAPAEITIVAAPTPSPPASKPVPPPTTQPKPTPVTQPSPKPVAKPAVPAPVKAPQPRPVQVPVLQTEAADAPVIAEKPAVAAPQLPPPPPPPPARSAAAGVEDQLAAAVREAVQAAVRYPPAARTMRQAGRAQVAFTYRDGAVTSNPRIVFSAGLDMLDQAALAAVRNAAYPPPPSEMANRAIDYLVWVEFNWITR
jgi:protein TonB